jgi:2-isopropylmalate synthase
VPEVARITAAAVARFGGDKVGVHCHNDSGLGRGGLARRRSQAGATLVQGTINGYGERVGNANLVTILPNLILKMGRTAHCAPHLASCATFRSSSTSWPTSGPIPRRPFVGQSAFAHKGGLHANAAQKVARSYEHIDPALVGNRTRVLVSDMAGRSSLALKARELGLSSTRSARR